MERIKWAKTTTFHFFLKQKINTTFDFSWSKETIFFLKSKMIEIGFQDQDIIFFAFKTLNLF